MTCDEHNIHPDDLAVNRFAAAMKAKLAAGRAKGRGGWDKPELCRVETLADMLVRHVGKGNPGTFEDIANLAMMLHQRGADPEILVPLDRRAQLSRLLTVAKGVIEWTEASHRPPVRDAFECGRTAAVRIHALADLNDTIVEIENANC